jgi:hypothetical protein
MSRERAVWLIGPQSCHKTVLTLRFSLRRAARQLRPSAGPEGGCRGRGCRELLPAGEGQRPALCGGGSQARRAAPVRAVVGRAGEASRRGGLSVADQRQRQSRGFRPRPRRHLPLAQASQATGQVRPGARSGAGALPPGVWLRPPRCCTGAACDGQREPRPGPCRGRV